MVTKRTVGTNERHYDNIVYQRMRHILMSYRDFWSGTVSKKYDWGVLAENICEFGDLDEFPKNALRNFVQGLKQEDKPSKYSVPTPDRIEAIIRFLTDKNSKGYFCEKAHLLEPVKYQAAFFEQEWLDESKEKISRFLKAEYIMGTYSGRYEEEGQPFDITLHFSSIIPGGAVHIYMHKAEAISDHVNFFKESYIGWASISDHDTITITVREQESRHSLRLLTAAQDNGFYDALPPQMLFLLPHDEPVLGMMSKAELLITLMEGTPRKVQHDVIPLTREAD